MRRDFGVWVFSIDLAAGTVLIVKRDDPLAWNDSVPFAELDGWLAFYEKLKKRKVKSHRATKSISYEPMIDGFKWAISYVASETRGGLENPDRSV